MSAQRTIVVSDVHGCLEELDELLRVVALRHGEDRLVFVGDLIDRGPDSVGVVRRARELKAECVQGNHEEKYLRFRMREREVREGRREENKMIFPGEKRAVFAQLGEDDWAYMEAMPLTLDLGEGVTVVHGGFEPGLSLAQQRPDKVVRLVYVKDDGTMAKHTDDFRRRPDGSRRWAEVWKDFSVVYGHAVFSLTDVTIDRHEEVTHWGIDTGCYAGGRLTAWVREAGQAPTLVQVQAKRCYRHRVLADG